MYKVVNHYLKSVIMDDCCNKGLVVQYKLDEFVYAPKEALEKGYGLCVFPTLDAAKAFNFGNLIFEVETTNQLPTLPLYGSIHTTTLTSIKQDSVQTKRDGWAENTVMVEAVKLIREVKQNKNMNNPLLNIDVELLKLQKRWLLAFSDKEAVGLVELLDNIQDYLVDNLHYPESTVFDFEDELQ